VELPIPPSRAEPTRYDLFISGDYEVWLKRNVRVLHDDLHLIQIRLFGDPRTQGSEIPVLSLDLAISVEHPHNVVVREPTHDVICDFVDGFSFGDAIGIGVRTTSGWWTLSRVELADSTDEVHSVFVMPVAACLSRLDRTSTWHLRIQFALLLLRLGFFQSDSRNSSHFPMMNSSSM
jgi:hypothetical protein